MKTSNKLLIGFLIFMLTVPLFFLSALKTKVKRGEFAMESNYLTITGQLGDYKVIKIDGLSKSPEALSCHIQSSISRKYEYNNFHDKNNFLSIKKINDTIFIQYNRKNEDKSNVFNFIDLNLFVPNMENVLIQNATVYIDSVNSKLTKMVNVKLQNNAVLNIGSTSGGMNSSNSYVYLHNQDDSYRILRKPVSTTQIFDSLNIEGETDSKVVLGGVQIKNLILNMQSNSKLEIPLSLDVNHISGKISAETSIKANSKGINALQPLFK
ncbi:hypothetical protein [Arachidicoccus sp.]|uniref:hypothetical protein n=1 Tax=Arachidicoccus sp. TaxID=1872624 RepID=UPI003D21D2D1